MATLVAPAGLPRGRGCASLDPLDRGPTGCPTGDPSLAGDRWRSAGHSTLP